MLNSAAAAAAAATTRAAAVARMATGGPPPPRVAVVGGGIAGTLASLVLRNRGLRPTILDRGHGGAGGRLRGSQRSKLGRHLGPSGSSSSGPDAGAQFLRAADPQLAAVMNMLERNGLVQRWEGRFGLLGSRGGGFLPSSVVGGAGLRDMKAADDASGNGSGSPTDEGDFCGFVSRHRDSVPTYVGVPSNSDLCPRICALAGVDVVSDAFVTKAEALPQGGWRLTVDGDSHFDDDGALEYDALVLTTHDPSLSAATVRSIADAEARAEAEDAGPTDAEADVAAGTIRSRLTSLADDLQSLRDDGGSCPLFTWSGSFPPAFSSSVPFDAASVPGSGTVQFLARESSKPGRTDDRGEVWTAVSTSALAADVLRRHGKTKEASDEASRIMAAEVSSLLAASVAADVSKGGVSPSNDSAAQRGRGATVANGATPAPESASAVRWASALSVRTMDLREDCVSLAPWFLCIGGDFIREGNAHETPFEAAALSGLEAGERAAAFFRDENA